MSVTTASRIATLLASFIIVSLSYAEILPMARDRLEEARQLGKKAVKEDQIIFTGTCRTKSTHGLHMFEVTLTTPFAAVAYASFDSKKEGGSFDLGDWPIDPADKQRVIVAADPAALAPVGLPPVPPVNVATVVLRRGEQVVEPDRTESHDVLFPGPSGKARKFRGGAFYFPLSHFASENGDLEIVVIPETDKPGAEAVLKLKRSQLAKLR